MIMVVVVVVMMAFIRIDSLLCLPSSTKLSNLAQRAQYLRLTIAGALKSVDIFPISAHDGPVSHWDELCPKKSSVDIAHIFFGKPSLSNSATKGRVTILQKCFSEIQV